MCAPNTQSLQTNALVKFRSVQIKALPIKQKKDGGYQIKLLGKGNDVIAYFNPDSNTLKSIVIIQGDMRSELSHITLVMEKNLNLEIGNESSSSFDLR